MSNDRIDQYIDGLFAEAPLPVAPAPAAAPAESVAAPVAPPPPAEYTLPPRTAAPAQAAAALLSRVHAASVTPGVRAKRWLRFSLRGHWFGIELLKVQEVQRVPRIVPVRGAPPNVLGVINLRGEIVHVIDTATELGIDGEDGPADAARVVVLEENGRHAGLLVSAVAHVFSLDDGAIERTESTLRMFPCPAFVGIARQGAAVIALLDGSGFLK